MPEYYATISKATWENYRKNLTGKCDGTCLDDFIIKVADNLLIELNRELEILKAQKIKYLVVDLTDNGGGTNWGEAVARTISSKKINAAKISLTIQKYTKVVFEKKLQIVLNDLDNKLLDKKQINLLNKSKIVLQKLVNESSVSSIDTNFWNNNNNTFIKPNLTSTNYFASGLFPYVPKSKTSNLISKGIIFSPNEFDYSKGKNDFKTLILVDKNTASAAEYFTALLKDNKCANIIGEQTYGCGCGFIEGGVKYVLPNTKFILKLPNCSRFRSDGTNEYKGIIPDFIIWNKSDTKDTKLQKLINYLKEY